MATLGMDLGTSNSAAAVLRGGRPVLIPSSEMRGNLFVRLDVRIPERVTRNERELYERLRELESSGAL